MPLSKIVQDSVNGGVAGTGPAFSAYLGTNQSVSANTWTKISINTETFDTNNCFDTSTYRFTPTVAGYYQVNGALSVGSGSATLDYVSITKNGTQHKIVFFYGGQGTSANIGDVIYCNGTTDYLELYGYCSSASTVTGDSRYTYFSASMVRAA